MRTDDAPVTREGRFEAPVEDVGRGESEALTEPSSSSDVARAYVDAALLGYVVYMVGAVTAFIATALALSDAEAGLHSSALAVGVVGAGFTSARLDTRFDSKLVHVGALVMLGLSCLALAWAVSIQVTLLAALGVGYFQGLILAHVIQSVSAGGGSRARVRYARGTLIATLGTLVVPLVISLGVAVGLGWRFVALPALLIIALALVLTRSRNVKPAQAVTETGRLPNTYWRAWSLVVVAIAIEFAVVVWGGTLVSRQTGATLADATLVITALTAGFIVARVVLSFDAVGRVDPIWILRGGFVITLAAAAVPWVATSFEVAVLGFFVCGIGLGALFPVGSAVTIATAPRLAELASGRLVLATGLAILLAPFVLGLVADATDVGTAWLLVPAMTLLGLVVTWPVARDRAAA